MLYSHNTFLFGNRNFNESRKFIGSIPTGHLNWAVLRKNSHIAEGLLRSNHYRPKPAMQ